MIEEMTALHDNDAWDLVPLPKGKTTVGCHWVFIVKVGLDGAIDCLKSRLIAKKYTQFYGTSYGYTSSPVANKAFVRLLTSMEAMNHSPLFQMQHQKCIPT